MSNRIPLHQPLTLWDILPHLACPRCHSKFNLGFEEELSGLYCRNCSISYPLDGQVADFRSPELSTLAPTDLHSDLKFRLKSRRKLFHTIQVFNRILFPAINLASKRNLSELGAICDRDFSTLPILNLGSGAGSGKGIEFLPRRIDLDAVPIPGVVVLADGAQLPFADGSLAAVLAQGVLEHLPDPWAVTREIERVLAAGGHIYIEVPLVEGYHPDPDDYWRFTRSGLRVLFKGFTPYREGATSGPASAAGLFLREFIGSFSTNRWIHAFLKYVLGSILALPLRPFDYWLGRKRNAHVLAASLHFWGIKPA